MKLLFSRSTRPTSFPAIISTRLPSRAAHSSPDDPRRQLLKEIYAPFAQLEKGSVEYNELAESGKCWSDYFKPSDMSRYKELESEYSSTLKEIDSYRDSIDPEKAATLTKSLVPEYAQQSVSIENNPLKLNHAHHIADHFHSTLFKDINIPSLSPSSLLSLPLPSPSSLIPTRNPYHVSELQNHILASHWSATTSTSPSRSHDLTEPQTSHLTAVLLKDTTSTHLHATSWGGRTTPGTYRKTPLKVKSNPLLIFPYPPEVPNLMKEFFSWRDSAHTQSTLHPLLLACQMVIYFVSIHPFLDGNGRASRVLMQDYLVRRGYFPTVIKGLRRGEYLGLVGECQDGRVEGFVGRVVEAQVEVMREAGEGRT